MVSVTDSVTDRVTDSVTDSVTDNVTDIITDRVRDRVTDSDLSVWSASTGPTTRPASALLLGCTSSVRTRFVVVLYNTKLVVHVPSKPY